jgi:hypothetical protein
MKEVNKPDFLKVTAAGNNIWYFLYAIFQADIVTSKRREVVSSLGRWYSYGFYTQHALMHCEFIPESATVKKNRYKQVSACLWEVICQKELTM